MTVSLLATPCKAYLNLEIFVDGRVSFTLSGDQVEIKYQHLNPATYFQEVVEVARSIVLAGGTMSPVSTLPSIARLIALTLHTTLRYPMSPLSCSLSSRQRG